MQAATTQQSRIPAHPGTRKAVNTAADRDTAAYSPRPDLIGRPATLNVDPNWRDRCAGTDF